jgi:hydroxyethylthiazole kinase
MFKNYIEQIRDKKPIVHCITNYVTVQDCANSLIASGGAPIMADDKKEVEEIVSIASALVINIGTLNQRTIESMLLAGKKANALGIPVILDPVGTGASKLRTDTTTMLLDEIQFAVIKGNISEMKTILEGQGTTKGVDADEKDLSYVSSNKEQLLHMAKQISQRTKAVITITGKSDLVTDETTSFFLHNGDPMMGSITGSGCMLAAIIGLYCGGCSQEDYAPASAFATALFSICGQTAAAKTKAEKRGIGSFRTYFIDELSKISYDTFQREANIEIS